MKYYHWLFFLGVLEWLINLPFVAYGCSHHLWQMAAVHGVFCILGAVFITWGLAYRDIHR